MKSTLFTVRLFMLTFFLAAISIICFGQDTTSTITTTTTDINITSENESDAWYMSPWVWIVGAAVFILLLVALLRGGGSDRTRDDDRRRDVDTDATRVDTDGTRRTDN